MEEHIISKHSLDILEKEMEASLKEADQAYAQLMQGLENLNPFLNLKTESTLHQREGLQILGQFKQHLKDFNLHLERAMGAYRDLSSDLQSLLAGNPSSQGILQELARQGALLAEQINLRHELSEILGDLASVLDRIVQQHKAGPAQQKKLEDCIFQLQVRR